VGDAIVGVVANPLSGRDIRRLVTQASVFPTAEKANMIQRMLTALAAVGVHRVLLGTDLGGISAAVFRAIERRQGAGGRWPEVEFLDGQPIRQTAQDTVDAVRRGPHHPARARGVRGRRVPPPGRRRGAHAAHGAAGGGAGRDRGDDRPGGLSGPGPLTGPRPAGEGYGAVSASNVTPVSSSDTAHSRAAAAWSCAAAENCTRLGWCPRISPGPSGPK